MRYAARVADERDSVDEKLNEGRRLLERGDWVHALELFGVVLEASPSDARARAGESAAHWLMDLEVMANQGESLNGEVIASGQRIANQQLELSAPRVALRVLQVCFRHDSRDPKTLELLARAFDALGQPDKAAVVRQELRGSTNNALKN